MPDTPQPPAAASSLPDDASSADVWSALCDLLGTDTPSDVISRVLAVHRDVHAPENGLAVLGDDLSPVEETEAVLHDVRTRLRTLRSQNEALVQQLDDEAPPEAEDSRRQLEALIDLVDADSFEATTRQIESLQQQVDALYAEKERLVAAGFASADEALAEIDRLNDQVDALRDRLNAASSSVTHGDAGTASPPSVHVNTDEASADASGDAEALREAVAYANDVLHAHLDEENEADALPDLTAESAPAARLRAYVDEVERLWTEVVIPAQTVVQKAKSVLGMTSIDDFNRIAQRTDRIAQTTQTLHEAVASHLTDIAPGIEQATGPRVTDQLQRVTTQLQALAQAAQAPHAFLNERDGLDPKIGTILGVSSVREAEEMVHIVQRMARQLDQQKVEAEQQVETLTELFEQHVLVDAQAVSQLHELVGQTPSTRPLADRRASLVMLHPLHEQLNAVLERAAEPLDAAPDTLPQAVDALRHHIATLQADAEAASASDAQAKLNAAGIRSVDDALAMIESMSSQLSELYNAQEATLSKAQQGNDGQSTFQQLEALYAEQDKLQRELGVSDADALISMIETMNAQLSELYEEREAQAHAEEAAARASSARASSADASSSTASEADAPDVSEALNSALSTIQALQKTAEQLSDDVKRLQDRTQRQDAAIEQLEQAQQNAGATALTTSFSADALAGAPSSDAESKARDAAPPSKKPGTTNRFELSASAPVFDTEQLNALRTAPTDRWDDHDVGVVKLDNDGTVLYINQAACALPRLQDADPEALVGKNFFTDLALSTNNDLFRGRFDKGTQCDAMQVCFPYTFIAPGYAPTVFNVHMHRHPQSDANWLLLETP